jgi:hypothetical protein
MTLAAGRVRTAGPVLHPRLCAVITAVSCLAHLCLAVENHHGAWLNALMLALAAVCVPCTVHIWRHSRVTAVRQVMASALLMVAVHSFLLLGSGAPGHGHSAGVAGTGGPTAAADLLAVLALEITTALLAATLVARLRVNHQRLPST